MEKAVFENICIYVTDMNITPFTVGLLKLKIVLPKVMLDSYSVEELKAIVQHEQTNIWLGHLWFGFAWDILRCLLWINPFLTIMIQRNQGSPRLTCFGPARTSNNRTPALSAVFAAAVTSLKYNLQLGFALFFSTDLRLFHAKGQIIIRHTESAEWQKIIIWRISICLIKLILGNG